MSELTWKPQPYAQKMLISASAEGTSACHVQLCWNNCDNLYPDKPKFLQSGDSIEFDLIKLGISVGTEVNFRITKAIYPHVMTGNVTCTENGLTGYYIYHANIIEYVYGGPAVNPFSTHRKFS